MNGTRDNLLLLIIADLRRQAFAVLLVLLILISAVFSIYTTHQTRELVSNKERLSQLKDDLKIEIRNLLIEENTLDEHSRIRRIAEKKLVMIQPSPENSVIVELP